jgi:signal peptidase I
MAPTLLGEHYRTRSERTGWDFELGHPTDQIAKPSEINHRYNQQVADPMLGSNLPIHVRADDEPNRPTPRRRMGDRILVVKCLYPFFEPDRFDIVVFKNPTDPNGPAGNYIKRLIGLPGESIWLLDGDVFVGSADDPQDFDSYAIQRKPEHVQRAVWQPLYRSDFPPRSFDVAPNFSEPWIGPGWRVDGRRYVCDQAEPTELTWDHRSIPILDVAPYNSLSYRRHLQTQEPDRSERLVRLSDIRVAATIVP